MAQQTMTLNQMMQVYQQLTADYQARRIDQASYSAALIGLRSQDAEGRWWTCTPEGGFLWYDGSRWLPGQPATVNPPGIPPLQTAPIVTGVQGNAALKEKVNRKVVVADPTMGPVGFILASIRGAFSGLKALIKNPKIVLLTLFVSLV